MSTKKITRADVRMYRMGTGDCFVVKFFAGTEAEAKFTMMIDCGTWSGSAADLSPFIKDLKAYVKNRVDLLVVTHEHKDHVHGFDACEKLFTSGFEVGQVWMGWTEEDATKTVQQWQKDYGQQKLALARATQRFNAAMGNVAYRNLQGADANGTELLAARDHFAAVLEGLTALHLYQNQGVYAGMLAGMKVVKEKLGKKKIKYFRPGDIPTLPGLPGIKFYVLGPPLDWSQVKEEAGGKGESYNHNKDLALSAAFADAIFDDPHSRAKAAPFDPTHTLSPGPASPRRRYDDNGSAWRRIDHDWLNSAGSLALRLNSLTNNLSLALAIEFEDSGRVMLFPGDAEFGSWASWHTIKWSEPSRNKDKHLTEDLLNRTVFYKVAHHLSHNGTAQRLGLEMMNHPDLAAMATLDYSIISSGWKTTMPNRAIVSELLRRTRGRLMVMNEKDLTLDQAKKVKLTDKVAAARDGMSAKERAAFKEDYNPKPLHLTYTVRG